MAWVPDHKLPQQAYAQKEWETRKCLKKIRGIVNKITSKNVENLARHIHALPINTTEKLDGLVNSVFEMALLDQRFSLPCAQLIQALCGKEIKTGTGKLKFRNAIITMCQKQFEKDTRDELRKEERLEIENCSNSQKKLELLAKLEYDEKKLRKRSTGNIRLICELYKMKIITSPIMMRIIGTLLDKADEVSLECLCVLMTTAGKWLETSSSIKLTAMDELKKQFRKVESIIENRGTSNYVRFLMLDVVEMRQRGWKPRRGESTVGGLGAADIIPPDVKLCNRNARTTIRPSVLHSSNGHHELGVCSCCTCSSGVMKAHVEPEKPKINSCTHEAKAASNISGLAFSGWSSDTLDSTFVDIIFEIAFDNLEASSIYAQMLQAHKSVKENKTGDSELKFRNLIITKCQKEFEKNMEELKKEERVKVIKNCSRCQKKLELLTKLECDEKFRKRLIGTIKLIGELYQIKILSSTIIMKIIETLLDKADEVSSECLRALLTKVGKQLETLCAQKTSALAELEKQFRRVEKIIGSHKTSNYVKLLMLDVVERRQRGWEPRRGESMVGGLGADDIKDTQMQHQGQVPRRESTFSRLAADFIKLQLQQQE